MARTCAHDSSPHSRAVMLSFTLDRSGSMANKISGGAEATRWQFVLRCVSTLLRFRLQHGHVHDMVTVIVYSSTATVTVAPVLLRELDIDSMFAHTPEPEGGTDISSGYTLSYETLCSLYNNTSHTTIPIFVVQIDLTDGYANAGISSTTALAELRRQQLHALDELGFDTMLATYAISSFSNAKIPQRVACAVGYQRSISRQILDHEFDEFHVECSVIAGLAANLRTLMTIDNRKLYVVHGADWQLYVHDDTDDNNDTTSMSHLDQEVSTLLTTNVASSSLYAMIHELDIPTEPSLYADDLPPMLSPLTRSVQITRDHWIDQVNALRVHLSGHLEDYLGVLTRMLTMADSYSTLLRHQSTTSASVRQVSQDYLEI